MNQKPTQISMWTANVVPNICRNFTPRFKSRDLARKLSPLFSLQRHLHLQLHLQLAPTTRDTPCKAHHPSCTTGEKGHPWTQEIQQIIGNACPLIDSASPAYKSLLRPPQMAGLACLRLIDRTSVLTAFPTITYSYLSQVVSIPSSSAANLQSLRMYKKCMAMTAGAIPERNHPVKREHCDRRLDRRCCGVRLSAAFLYAGRGPPRACPARLRSQVAQSCRSEDGKWWR
jgi:hypothetical protein